MSHLKQQTKHHMWQCILLSVFNAADAMFTYYFLLNGGKELNPLMSAAYEEHPLLFLGIKFLFSILILMIGVIPLRKRIQRLITVAFSVYILIISWQLFLLAAHVKMG